MEELIILAAGRGSRMKGLTEDSPKCLTPLLGRSLLDWQLESARKAGIKHIHVIGGYCSQKLPGELVDFINPRWAETNMVSTLFMADKLLLTAPCIIAYSDILYRPSHLQILSGDNHACSVLYDRDWERLWRLRSQDFLSDAESFIVSDGFLADIGKKNVALSEIQGQYMGLLKFTPSSWKEIRNIYHSISPEQQDKIDMTSFIRELLSRNMKIAAIPISGGWVEVDTESDRDLYESIIQQSDAAKRGWSHDWRQPK